MLCGWGLKAAMVRVWVAGKTVVISDRFRDEVLYNKALYKRSISLTLSLTLYTISVPLQRYGRVIDPSKSSGAKWLHLRASRAILV